MDADSIKIECEEDGFWLVIDAPNFANEIELVRYRITDPEALYDHVQATIWPWLYEKNQAKIEYERQKRAEDTRQMSEEEFSAYLDDAYGDDWSKREGMKQMREQGYA